jgi:GrpB-like predicted nucleotidyltransferase (UPF0157 family)
MERQDVEAPAKAKNRKSRVGWCGPSMTRYLNEQRWAKNQMLGLRRHLKAHPNDLQAWRALDREPNGYHPKRMRVPRGTARRLERHPMLPSAVIIPEVQP